MSTRIRSICRSLRFGFTADENIPNRPVTPIPSTHNHSAPPGRLRGLRTPRRYTEDAMGNIFDTFRVPAYAACQTELAPPSPPGTGEFYETNPDTRLFQR